MNKREVRSTPHKLQKQKTSHGKTDASDNVDFIPSNVKSSHQEAMWYVFEDNEAVIKMIITGRSPTMRHVSRTHRVALDRLFGRIYLDSKIQIKYVDAENQLSDLLTQGGFTRDEWNHLLCLFYIKNIMMNVSMISCSHFSVSSRKQSAMSKGVQEGTSKEGSAMAKPRPMNLVSRNLLSARRIHSPQDMSNSSNPVNVKTEQGDVEQMRNTSQDPAMHSQVRQQEDTEHVSTWNQEARNDFSDSSGIWKQTRGVDTNMNSIIKISNYQYAAKVFQYLKNRLGITENSSTVEIEALKTNVLMWVLFMASTMKAASHLGPSYTANLEAYQNTNFEEFHFFGITQKLILGHSEEILNVNQLNVQLHHVRDLHCLMIK